MQFQHYLLYIIYIFRKDQQFISIVDQFRDDFTAKGIKIAFCKRKSGSKVGSYRWLEFIDVEALDEPYAPQFDVSNFSGQIIKTVYMKLQFPNGVAVEELKVSAHTAMICIYYFIS